MVAVAGGIIQAADLTTLAAQTTGRPLVRLIQQSAQSIASSTSVALTFGSGSEDIDTHNFHDPATNTTRVTPTSTWAGYYRCTVTFHLSAAGTTTQMYACVSKNGTQQQPLVRHKLAAVSATHAIVVVAILALNGTGDYVEAIGNQTDSGAAARNTQASGGVNSTFEVEFLRPL